MAAAEAEMTEVEAEAEAKAEAGLVAGPRIRAVSLTPEEAAEARLEGGPWRRELRGSDSGAPVAEFQTSGLGRRFIQVV